MVCNIYDTIQVQNNVTPVRSFDKTLSLLKPHFEYFTVTLYDYISEYIIFKVNLSVNSS